MKNALLKLCRSVGVRCHAPLRLLAIGVMALPLPAMALPATPSTLSLPPPEDVPEEVARTEIILEARSPVDGEPLTAAEYVQLRAELGEREYPPELSSELQQLIFLLRVRKLIRTFTPIPL